MYSLPVKAFISPPTASTAAEISRAERVVVPLKSKCSRKWDAPATEGLSSREPTFAQMPKATLRTVGTSSVTIRRPDGRVVRETVIALLSAFDYSASARTGSSESLPFSSISPMTTSIWSPTFITSSIFSIRLPPCILRICETWSNPSLPG